MKNSIYENHVYKNRVVRFYPYSQDKLDVYSDKCSSFIDDLADIWPGDLFVAGSNGNWEVSCWPWWYPMTIARRAVAKVALEHGLGGHAVSQTEIVSFPAMEEIPEDADD